MVMKALRQGASGGITKFLLFGFLVFAVGGLVLMDVGGVFRNGVGSSDAARVGKEKISIAAFDHTVRQTLQRIGMNPQEAYKVGYIHQIMSAEIRNRLLQQAARNTGIYITTDRIADKIRDIVTPMAGPDGNPQDVLKQILMNQGISQQDLVESMGRDMANGLLTSALQGGLQNVSDQTAHDLYRYQKESRSIQYVLFPDSDMQSPAPPSDDKLQELYNALKESYAKNETRAFKIITIKTDKLKETIDIPDEEIRSAYDDNIDLYSMPAQRTLDQALLTTEEQAKATRAELGKGKSLEQAVKTATGNATAYLGEKTVADADLMPEIKDQALAVQKDGEIIGPLNTSLGWFVIAVKKISPAKVRSFEEAKAEIKNERVESQLEEQKYALANTLDDLFASGATLEDAAKEVDLEIKALPPMNNFGQKEDGKDALTEYAKNRNSILESGFSLGEGETSPVFQNDDGTFHAVYVEHIEPKSYTPFEKVKEDLVKRWVADQKRLANQARIAQIQAALATNPTPLKEIASKHGKTIQSLKNITRTDEPKSPFNPQAISMIFETEIGKPVVVDVEGGFAVADTTGFSWPEKIDEKAKDFITFEQNLAENNRDEGLILYLEQKRADYGAAVNTKVLEQAYGSTNTEN